MSRTLDIDPLLIVGRWFNVEPSDNLRGEREFSKNLEGMFFFRIQHSAFTFFLCSGVSCLQELSPVIMPLYDREDFLAQDFHNSPVVYRPGCLLETRFQAVGNRVTCATSFNGLPPELTRTSTAPS